MMVSFTLTRYKFLAAKHADGKNSKQNTSEDQLLLAFSSYALIHPIKLKIPNLSTLFK